MEKVVKDSRGRVLKVGIILYTIDPNGEVRFLLRHSKPFGGWPDEWTIAFGSVEDATDLMAEARREGSEEFGIEEFTDSHDLDYEIEYDGKHGFTVIHFFSFKVPDIDVRVILNEESIGYCWMKLDEVMAVMVHEDEKEAMRKVYKKIIE